jgi:hypothetical protein
MAKESVGGTPVRRKFTSTIWNQRAHTGRRKTNCLYNPNLLVRVQEFDLSVRMSDTEAQTAVLRRCQGTKGVTAQNYLTMAALCRQSGGAGTANGNAQQACLKFGLRHMSQQMPVTEFALIAQVRRLLQLQSPPP